MDKRLKILLTNDDGISAPGIFHLWRSLKDFADIDVVAPVIEKSGSGLGMTLTKPLQIHSFRWQDENTSAWSVSGTPSDCVRLAVSVILKQPPDLIVSGINRGSNAGRNVLYSGTIAGVIEGVLRDIPGFAFSCVDFQDPDYTSCEKYVYPIIRHFLAHPLPKGSLINVNFPSKSHGKIVGFKMARQGLGYWIENPARRHCPQGRPYYWMGGKWSGFEEKQDSDVALLKQGYVTAVPIHVSELTDHSLLESHKTPFENLFQSLEEELLNS